MQVLFTSVLLLASPILALDNGLARKPQMGWNSWNWFYCSVNESVVMKAADILISSGLADLGYHYVNVDDCWAGYRDGAGFIHPDPSSFPAGMKALADYVHSKGLKFGLYSDSGNETCAGRPGTRYHEKEDAITYARWGVDYLKFDNCNALKSEPPKFRYPIMRDALLATGAPIFFSLCEWGVQQPWLWASDVGNSWRTDMDIGDDWNSFIRVLDDNIGLSPYSGPGGWNDPDMLQVGNGGMSYTEYQSHFALWCLLKAPLLIGNDLAALDNWTMAILGAEELIAVNQDDLGVQGDMIWQFGVQQIWAGPLADGSRVFILFNRVTSASFYNINITMNFTMLGFPEDTTGTIRDLYAEEDVGIFTDSFTASVLPHGVFAGRFIPADDDVKEKYYNWRPWF